MTTKTSIVLAAIALTTTAGCATTIEGSARARPNFSYAVGSKNGYPAAWLCPDTGGACKQVQVVTEED